MKIPGKIKESNILQRSRSSPSLGCGGGWGPGTHLSLPGPHPHENHEQVKLLHLPHPAGGSASPEGTCWRAAESGAPGPEDGVPVLRGQRGHRQCLSSERRPRHLGNLGAGSPPRVCDFPVASAPIGHDSSLGTHLKKSLMESSTCIRFHGMTTLSLFTLLFHTFDITASQVM